MDVIDLSRGQQATLQDPLAVETIPHEILEIIRLGSGPNFLDAIAAASLIPSLTLKFLGRFEGVFADTCARWITGSSYESRLIVEAFARILPFAPHLSVFLEKYLQKAPRPPQNQERVLPSLALQYFSGDAQEELSDISELELQRLLLAALRLLIFDKRTFARSISSSKVQRLLPHSSRPVRYLAARILCIFLAASDAKLEEVLDAHVGRGNAIMGDFDGFLADYRFLDLFEEKASNQLEEMRKSLRDSTGNLTPFYAQDFSILVSRFDDILLPRSNGQPIKPSRLVRTTTTSKNLRDFAQALLSDSPVLVHGLSGSGKTSVVTDFARELGKDSQMVTLHLNEQSDAKMLIGMYATGSTPGSFTWRPGVLTTAIREGRWVFIEDLDRAPNEVVSVILPLIERREILIPSRAETVKAAPGFRLIASIRTSLNMNGHEIAPAMHMLGARLWKRVPIKMPDQREFMRIVNAIHPILHKFLPGVLGVYERLYAMSQKPSFTSKGKISGGRPIGPRDLLKWCRRLDAILVAAGSNTGEEPISETTKDKMFMEAVDCFASSLQTLESKKSIIYSIAEEMHIPAQRVEYYLDAYIPRYQESEAHIEVGRVKISKKKKKNRVIKPSSRWRPFANTTHAKRLLEQVGVALKMVEPVLLVGETGIGKTTVVQQLADSLGYKLTAINLSQQSEVGDLLGGFKPVNVRNLAIPLKEEFDDLFSSTGISATRNQKYLEQLGKCVAKGQWSKASKLWHEAPRMFEKILSELSGSDATRPKDGGEQPTKRRKTDSRLQTLLELKPRWARFAQNLDQFDVQLSGGSKGFAFTYVEGNIVKAVRNGDWVLLDEINLASPDTLESIADLLHHGLDGSPSILLSETGEIERIRAHPNFRIFGAMNPATDVGKRDLPIGLRSRFTEIYVESPDRDLEDLLSIIKAYLKSTTSNDERAAHDIARLYLNTKRLADEKRLVDGANQVPHFSLRTLTRVLGYATEIAPSYGLRRALYEGFSMGFLTLLNRESERMLIPLINYHLLENHSNPQSLLSQAPRHPEDGREYVRFMNKKRDRQYWMLQGREGPQEQPHYIITPFVERNMLNLVRATSTRRFPVLIQGPTSSGKTSMIEYLAKFSGNKFVRINNHEHTDLQEYLGTYVSGADGQLRFQEGLLVQSLREGHWIVLDELNLAPSDVLEALNRLLDDNRELLIPETQEVVRPHQNFMLFATQNPPGLYGGRKTLSRAFRNRFLELHFDDIPEDELEYILEKRSLNVAPSDCKRIVTVYKELSRLRQSNRLFEQKDSFATLRDLFRWASRNAENREQLAANGYMLLAERVRKFEERCAVRDIIERVMKVKLDTSALYASNSCPEIQLYNTTANLHDVVWNNAMRRLYILVSHALRNNEPVLLVGETGCGKTTVCQMLAGALGKTLHIVNAHQNTETGDLIGAQRPVRNRAAITRQLEEDLIAALNRQNGREVDDSRDLVFLLAAYNNLSDEAAAAIPEDLRQRIKLGQMKAKSLFEWVDGSLVHAMKEGQFFLLDEISLAEDSVLERLNSVLEPERTLLLAEKGAEDSFVQASHGFQFFATMNPGGDYGKRELSPALRNRLTEIWVPSLSDTGDVLQIVEAKLFPSRKHFAKSMVEFAEWFGRSYRSSMTQPISVRDVLAWITFVNNSTIQDPYSAVMHGAAMIYIDTLGANPASLLAIDPATIIEERRKCLKQLSILLDHDIMPIYAAPILIEMVDNELCFGNFSIKKTPAAGAISSFAFQAPTTKLNSMRLARALQVRKPILIEGNPGVGKTTLVTALAGAVGKPLTRINLSEQTDLMDLFGSDVPVEGAEAGNFAWRDAPFLQAMQNGSWVLLDEMNLASQSVLEGLNACLDHRGTVYISELDQSFKRHPDFCVFAAQNPHHQGGGRKGLPSSFVNRFTVVYADIFRNDDLTLICKHNFPTVSDEILSKIVVFVSTIEQEVVHRRRFGSQGGPWEFNLRDSLRWLQLLGSSEPLLAASCPTDFLDILFRQRFRTAKDRQEVQKIFSQVFETDISFRHYFHNLSKHGYQVGMAYLPRQALTQRLEFPTISVTVRLPELESIMMCIGQGLPCLLVGPSGSGKTTLLQQVAAAVGTELVIFSLSSDIDTIDLVGGYEQVDPKRASSRFLTQLYTFMETCVLSSLPNVAPYEALEVLSLCQKPLYNSIDSLADIHDHLLALYRRTNLQQLSTFITQCGVFLRQSSNIQTAHFEWVDGVLIQALEEGKWLVLDNANLCSSSVLDRLNSLLEPNGFLSVNEHCGPNGEPKVIKPHPDFRLFITMDPRFGELSRAMRNRAIEIYIDTNSERAIVENTCRNRVRSSDAFLQRYRRVVKAVQSHETSNQTELLAEVAFDHLSIADVSFLRQFNEVASNGLLNVMNPKLSQISHQYTRIMENREYENLRETIQRHYSLLEDKLDLLGHFKDAQPIQPMQNSPLVPLLDENGGSGLTLWLGILVDTHRDILSAIDAKGAEVTALATLKPSQMNRLQRSMCRDRLPSVTKDSTVGVAMFLDDILGTLQTHLKEILSLPDDWIIQKKLIGSIMHLWWETYRLASSPTFEDAIFQAHLGIWRDFLSRMLPKIPPVLSTNHTANPQQAIRCQKKSQNIVEIVHGRLRYYFDSEFTLTSGLSMEKLWRLFRPKSITSTQKLEVLVRLEELATRFDHLKWRASMSVSELSSIASSLVGAYSLILTSDVDGRSLVEALVSEIANLEERMTVEISDSCPFFSTQFDALRQYNTLQHSENTAIDIVTLADHPTASLLHLNSATSASINLQKVHYFWGDKESLFPIEDSFSASLLHEIHQIDNVGLNMLSLLEMEIPVLGQHIAQETTSLCRDQVLDMNTHLLGLVNETLRAHSSNLGPKIENIIGHLTSYTKKSAYPNQAMTIDYEVQPNESAGLPRHFEEVLLAHLLPTLNAITDAADQTGDRMKLSSLAWIHFAIGCITLYVPDRPFDPNIREFLERAQYNHAKEKLENKIAALRMFENMFTGQNSNLRCQLLEQELFDLREPTEVSQAVSRPETSELDQLQGEFNNLLDIVLRSKPIDIAKAHIKSGQEETLRGIKLLQSNVSQVIHRLSKRFRAYSDITVPLVGMLQCLQVGLHMAKLAPFGASLVNTTIMTISGCIPFLGGGPLRENFSVLDEPLDNLSIIAMIAGVEGLDSFNANQRKIFLDTVHSCYTIWSKKLEADRKEADLRSRLYRFRGNAEQDEEDSKEEFNELFPDFGDESSHSTPNPAPAHSARDTAVALARIHAKIVLEENNPTESIMSALRHMSKRIGIIFDGLPPLSGGAMTRNLLPGVLLSLSDHMEALKAMSATTVSYNFYTDANLPEARKLVLLVQQIQTRFQELQNLDEISHMQPLEDVMISCRELLRFRHTEPLAKIITKVEKVHTCMHEWQFGGWASRANSVIALYDQLTSMIISWRRLELATWARLFDIESKKCEDDAKSWWFVAYEVVIAAPLSMSQSKNELRSYAQRLLQDLEAYFTTAIQGQFGQRLHLLKQLERHLEVLVIDVPQISVILNAVANFTGMYKRFEKPVSESLQKGRLVLEKAMRDVILLASWKDTNIIALRDSARRSHHKLFKLVRKYRALLGQPMEQILKNGLPDEATDPSPDTAFTAPTMLPILDKYAMALCESNIPHWSKKSKRLVNVSKTVTLMDEVGQIPATAVDGVQQLELFLSNIISSTAELHKATPSIVNEENRSTARYLKSRKRKFFADTLRELRQMGVKHNLSTTALTKQESLSVILSSTENMVSTRSQTIGGLEYYYYKAIDSMPRARTAARQHSQDLSSAEVTRSTGLLEGLLNVLLKQRNALAMAITDSEKLEKTIHMMQALWAPGKYDIIRSGISSNQNSGLKWLPNILRVGSELVAIHGQMGKVDNTGVLKKLSSHIRLFDDLSHKWTTLPTLPPGVCSTAVESLKVQIDDAMGKLRLGLHDMSEERPDIEFILHQIRPWATATWDTVPVVPADGDISVVDQALSRICDSVLVAIKDFSALLEQLPRSTEDADWLVRTSSCLLDSIASLHIREITTRINSSFDFLNNLSLAQNHLGKVVTAVFAMALPILQQYFIIVQKAVLRVASLHRTTCKMTYILAKTFTQIALQGFCAPEKSDTQDGTTDKLDSGTGLGDGEGADDISKDIQDDEDLSELAQEPNKGEREDIEDEKDAVDMADDDMEGEMGEAGEKKEDEEDNGTDHTDGDDIDEEAGDVDDLDPNAVDEKMWDGEAENSEKEQRGDQSKGKPSRDEQMAAQEDEQEDEKEAPEGGDGEEGEEEHGAEQGEEIKHDEVERYDPHAQEGQALEMPEEMDLDGSDQERNGSSSDGDMDDLSDVENDAEDGDGQADETNLSISESEDGKSQDNQDAVPDVDVVDPAEDEDHRGRDTEEAGEKAEDKSEPDVEDHEKLLRDRSDDATVDPNDPIPSNVQGTGEYQDEIQADENTASTSKAQREDGGKGGETSDQIETSADEGDAGRPTSGNAHRNLEKEHQANVEAKPFKKLGDTLERWYRQQTKIREASEIQERSEEQHMELDMDNAEYQHLQDDEAKADTQALGTAMEDQAHTLDESMAIENETEEMPQSFQQEAEADSDGHDEMDTEIPSEHEEPKPSEAYEGRAGAIIRQANTDYEKRLDQSRAEGKEDIEEDLGEVDIQLSSTHIDDPNVFVSRSASDARQLWAHYESLTRDLSLSLTEQLRLILAPTQATKMRGDFRTGKRLNIKRIIPYIASQYKRDKIWMRRSVPSKRSYQIMLAVDDSKSMGESGSASLAFETLIMVSKSLSMLEVGEICIAGFGEKVRVSHDFDMPFNNEAGSKVLQNFGFNQGRTDVTKLVRESIDLFRRARAKASSSPADLWQLELIISDGVCDSSEHEPIRRLLREAVEERIMMVFVIVDDLKSKKSGESVIDLKEAKFVKDEATGASNVKIERYLDTFPFQYYLIVSDVKELPGVLATLLRQWFAEVADSSG